MVDYIIPSSVSDSLTKDSKKQVVIRRTYVLEKLKVYRYTFDLMVDGFPKLIYVDLEINRMMSGTTVWPEIYQDLLKQIKELPNATE